MSSTRIPADPTGDLATTEVGNDLIGSGQEGGLGDQVRAWFQRVRGGDMGALPAVAGFIVLSVLFSILSPFFLTERNFANLMTQAATLVMLGMALVFVILLGEIDLSAGVTAGVTMCIFIVLVNVQGLNWIVALAIAFGIGIVIGTFIGFFVARVGIPSFVVTLGLFLGLQGVELIVIGAGGLYRVQIPEIRAIQNENLPIWAGWVLLAVVLVVSAATSFWDRPAAPARACRTARSPWSGPSSPRSRCSAAGRLPAEPQPRPGADDPERRGDRRQRRGGRADRGAVRAGHPVARHVRARPHEVRPLHLRDRRQRRGGATCGHQGRVHPLDRLHSAASSPSSRACSRSRKVGSVDAAAGRDLVLSGVAAAVVGGVSLFGGRGRLIHAAIGALVIAVITNGLGLLNLPAGVNYAVTGGVLILAATVDAVSRKRAGGTMLRT